jgi:hypothetical protein
VFTHRLSTAEIEHGLGAVTPDLEPLSALADTEPYDRLVGGAPLVEIFPDVDADLITERGMPVDALEIYSRVALADAQQAYDQTIGRFPV